MSKFSFSFRRSERKAFKHIAHGLIPAATIAPRPAVPRTPPPRSPNPSPERPRSALAAAILSSSLTGRTVAIPPPRHRSYSESDCSHTDSQTGFEPYASTALYTRDQWPDSMAGRPRLPSPQPDDDDDDDDDDDEEEEIEDTERDESHVYQSVEIQSRDLDIDAVYATPLKQVVLYGFFPDVFHSVSCVCVGESSELLSLRQQAQELVDENDGLKMTVHRLNVELSRYQARFKPLTKEECSQSGGLPVKRPSPPWLLDMKYLSPLLLAYEDQLMERDKLLKSCEEEVKRLRVRSEEVIQENEKLHAELGKRSSVSNKEWRQLQDQARLVLEENQVLIEQLELQHTKAKETHTKHTQEVCKVSKQVMLLEAEKHALEAELETVRKELQTLKVEFQKTCTTLQNSVSWGEHNSTTDKLKRYKERIKSAEIKELQACVNALQAEKRTLLVEKTNLSTDVKHLENELQLAHQANRKAQRRIDLLKQQVEDSLEKELVAHQYLTSVVTLAEKTTYERDQLMHMASCLEKDKQGVLTRIIEGTVRLGKLQEKVKVFKQQARAGVCALGRRLQEQEQDFAGKAATFQREIQHLQAQLRERQEQLHGALQQKRAVENELEVVWEAAARENQHLQSMVMGVSRADGSLSPVTVPAVLGCSGLSQAWTLRPLDSLDQSERPSSTVPPPFTSRHNGLPPSVQHSPGYKSDNPSSDESQKNGLDFYS
uniref:Centrosomal protein 89 n=1 Tax=Pygocentrus nattereri TaxID=42514 RepID=A0AAR2L325_PYGNA